MTTLEQRVEALEKGLETHHDLAVGQYELSETMYRLLLAHEERFNAIDGRLDKIDGRLDKTDGRLDKIDGRLDALEKKVDVGFQSLARDLSGLASAIRDKEL